jgi:hypothetical protein
MSERIEFTVPLFIEFTVPYNGVCGKQLHRNSARGCVRRSESSNVENTALSLGSQRRNDSGSRSIRRDHSHLTGRSADVGYGWERNRNQDMGDSSKQLRGIRCRLIAGFTGRFQRASRSIIFVERARVCAGRILNQSRRLRTSCAEKDSHRETRARRTARKDIPSWMGTSATATMGGGANA